MSKKLLALVLLMVPVVVFAGIKQRTVRSSSGDWVQETYLEIAEFEMERSNPELSMDIHLGHSTNDNGEKSYWVEIESEIEYRRGTVTNQELQNIALGVRSLMLNGVHIESTSANTTIEERMKDGKEKKEYIRITITREQMEQIVRGNQWNGTITADFLGNRERNLQMKRRNRIEFDLQRLL
ncbi:hypothetical protein [Entomospira culicis]|uniref:Uncharacterized protein n=1 Tax=Entomospira culicis TaxID=2719989 RepID=A0A968KTS7_9SPIO|nr:hypothetical protein [Entomospira culicis]NIZ18548.1 hypothetical protein [Entomospira culicis]NIZ68764.1 hypothetical protein [Entomospira culicis]WDI37360.1 hypothetical protein PVA46_00810 [Entomospira culicis]WDI38989.1 hypothetical protein PVA47_00820 [Entomospira culicis]